MDQRQRIKGERGITLVALIITIIVLVILAAVSISAAFNTGIIDTAVNGAVNYAEAQRQEQVTFDELDSNLQDIVKKIESYDVGGSNSEKTTKPNAPVYEGTGLIPVYHNGSSWVDLTSSSTADEWNKWYDYENQKWANARTADGSMWVWIPRYEYKIDDTAKTIAVNFIEGTSTAGASGYTLHPAFSTDIENGGWDSDIEGFWVAKYPAGWQNGTDGATSIGTPDRSNINYQTTSASSTYDGNISTSTKMSYPVFKANTYAYNYITVGDAYTLSQDIKNATRYGLDSSKVDSHLQKNSEWGAVAYLAHSKYGVNGQDIIKANKTNKNNTPTGIHAVTSPETVVNTSTTQNITGIYDMSGGVYEYKASFLQGGTTSYTTGMPTGNSSKYLTIYTGFAGKAGDAIIETSGWNGDYANFVTSSVPVFDRGGSFIETEASCGVFAFDRNSGRYTNYHGFRAVLVP